MPWRPDIELMNEKTVKQPPENLTSIESELTALKPRLLEIKTELAALKTAKPTREELRQSILQWLSRVTGGAGENLYSRLELAGFLSGVDSNHDSGILFADSRSGWEAREVRAAGLLALIRPQVEAALNAWVDGLPAEKLGQFPVAEKTVRIEKLESERSALLARRDVLQQRLREILSLAGLSGEQLKAMTAGGVFTGPDSEKRLAEKYFQAL